MTAPDPREQPGRHVACDTAIAGLTARADEAEAKLAEIGRQCARAAGVLRSGVPFSLHDVMVDARYILEITGSEDDGGEAFNRLASERNAIGQVIRCAQSWQMQGGHLDASGVAAVLLGVLAPWTGLPLLTGAQCDRLAEMVAEHENAVSIIRRALDVAEERTGELLVIAAARDALRVLSGEEGARNG